MAVLWWTDVGESVEVPRDPVGSAFFERNRTVQMFSSQAVLGDTWIIILYKKGYNNVRHFTNKTGKVRKAT